MLSECTAGDKRDALHKATGEPQRDGLQGQRLMELLHIVEDDPDVPPLGL